MREMIRGVVVVLVALGLLTGFLILIAGFGFWRLADNGGRGPRQALAVVTSAPARLGPRPEQVPQAGSELHAASGTAVEVASAQRVRAALIRVDDTSAGGWVGRYGKKGYRLATTGEPASLPPRVDLSMDGAHPYIWSSVTTDRRGLSIPADPARLSAGQWFSWDQFTLDLDLRQAGEPLQVALYLLDWDSDSRAQRLDVIDADSRATLFSRTDEHFNKGRYLLLRLSGHVVLRFTRIAGANCTLSAVFFDELPAAAQ